MVLTMKIGKSRSSSCSSAAAATTLRSSQIVNQRPLQRLLASTNQSLTPFQMVVYTALCRVPEGYVTTYQQLARFVHCGSNQAIGQALRRNPFAPQIPCHRVVSSNRSLGGFHGCIGGEPIHTKRKLLEREGVSFDQDGKVNAMCIYEFPHPTPQKKSTKRRGSSVDGL